ncbi:hypothetical protein FQR65_LT03194 [Abscondita terminalis]|nr:hypothetical protein FQR65_LT03194 [Abscondita terminalis]
MKLLILLVCFIIVSANAFYAPVQNEKSIYRSSFPIRSTRAVNSADLEGSESAYSVYPYLSYPYFYHTPVVYIGK